MYRGFELEYKTKRNKMRVGQKGAHKMIGPISSNEIKIKDEIQKHKRLLTCNQNSFCSQ